MSEPALGATDEFAAVAVRSDGKIVAAGDTVANSLVTLRMARFTSMGELDATFGGDGVVEDDGFRNINALALTPDDGCVFTVTSAPPHVPYVFRLLP
jgi:hypothetical protein